MAWCRSSCGTRSSWRSPLRRSRRRGGSSAAGRATGRTRSHGGEDRRSRHALGDRSRRRRAVRPRQRGVAAQPRGDAPARRGPAGAVAPDRASAGRRGRCRALGLSQRPVGAPLRDAPVLPANRLRDRRCGPRREPPPGRAAPRHPGPGRRPERVPPPPTAVQRARPGPLAVGPRDPRRLDDRGLRRVDRAALARGAVAVLRGDTARRSSVRHPGVEAPRGPRRLRGVPGPHARARRPDRGRRPPARARRGHPASAPRPCDRRRRLAVHPPRARGRCDLAPRLRVAVLALDRVAARDRPRGLRLPVGAPPSGRVDLARRDMGGMAADAPAVVPPDAPGPPRRPTRGCRPAERPDRGLIAQAHLARARAPARSPRTISSMQTATAIDALLADVRAELPQLRLLTDVADRESYRLDETAYLAAGLPGAVVLPTETAEVAALLRLASRHRVAVVPRGAGTGLSGGAAGIEGALTIAVTRMNRIVEIDRDNLCVVTQPGVINAELKAAVAAEGLFYPPDPASYDSCSIGANP